MFIGLTSNKHKIIFNINHIVSIVDAKEHGCHIYTTDYPNPFAVDETYEEIIDLLKKAVQYEF